MSLNLIPGETVIHLSFQGSECLYRDHHGRRVIADFEGQGFARILQSQCDLQQIRGDGSLEEFKGSFDDLLLLVTPEVGNVDLLVSLGRLETDFSSETLLSESVLGGGWILSAKAPVNVDHGYGVILPGNYELPIPFYESAVSASGFKYIPSRLCGLVTDSLGIHDGEALKNHDFVVQNMSTVFPLDSSFEDGTRNQGHVASHLNAAELDVKLDPDNYGVVLQKVFDQFHGRQRARVFVDGEFIGWWYEPRENRRARWSISRFGVPQTHTKGKSSLRLRIEPPAGVPLWSVGRLDVLCLVIKK